MTLIYKLDKAPPIIQTVLDDLGWVEFEEEKHQSDQWNLLWKSTRTSQQILIDQRWESSKAASNIKSLFIFQRQGCYTIFGPVYNFTPTTFILPNEYKKFVEEFTKSDDKQIWICKPADLSRGRKIFLINDIGELQYDQQSIIQKYIANPLLIRGYKWDMRVYVLITQARPLKLYLYKEGIVRFSTEKYDTNTIKNVFSHLTNSSINKFAANVNIMSGGAFGSGIKWTFSQLRSYFRDQNIGWDKLWVKIESIIILTVVNLASAMPDLDCCFELFGFDIMVDNQLKPWLIEVNSSPAMSMDNNIDYQIKPDLIKDIISLLNFEPYEIFNEKLKKKQTIMKQLGANNFFKKRSPIVQANQYNPSILSQQKPFNKLNLSNHKSLPLTSQQTHQPKLLSHFQQNNNMRNNIKEQQLLASHALRKATQMNFSPSIMKQKGITNMSTKRTDEFRQENPLINENDESQNSQIESHFNLSQQDIVSLPNFSLQKGRSSSIRPQQLMAKGINLVDDIQRGYLVQSQKADSFGPNKSNYSTKVGYTAPKISRSVARNDHKKYKNFHKSIHYTQSENPKNSIVNCGHTSLPQTAYQSIQGMTGSITNIEQETLGLNDQIESTYYNMDNRGFASMGKKHNDSFSISDTNSVMIQSRSSQKDHVMTHGKVNIINTGGAIIGNSGGDSFISQSKRTKTACSTQASIQKFSSRILMKDIDEGDEHNEQNLSFMNQTKMIGAINSIHSSHNGNIANQQQNSKLINLSSKINFKEREKNGKFELIFPFNKASEDLVIALNRSQGSSVSGPNYMKMIIQEIKKWECEYLEYISSNFNY